MDHGAIPRPFLPGHMGEDGRPAALPSGAGPSNPTAGPSATVPPPEGRDQGQTERLRPDFSPQAPVSPNTPTVLSPSERCQNLRSVGTRPVSVLLTPGTKPGPEQRLRKCVLSQTEPRSTHWKRTWGWPGLLPLLGVLICDTGPGVNIPRLSRRWRYAEDSDPWGAGA